MDGKQTFSISCWRLLSSLLLTFYKQQILDNIILVLLLFCFAEFFFILRTQFLSFQFLTFIDYFASTEIYSWTPMQAKWLTIDLDEIEVGLEIKCLPKFMTMLFSMKISPAAKVGVYKNVHLRFL